VVETKQMGAIMRVKNAGHQESENSANEVDFPCNIKKTCIYPMCSSQRGRHVDVDA
jgi:hypothetical protein